MEVFPDAIPPVNPITVGVGDDVADAVPEGNVGEHTAEGAFGDLSVLNKVPNTSNLFPELLIFSSFVTDWRNFAPPSWTLSSSSSSSNGIVTTSNVGNPDAFRFLLTALPPEMVSFIESRWKHMKRMLYEVSALMMTNRAIPRSV